MRLGIFGGSFNPIHCGHLHAAEVAVKQAQLDNVVFVPCGNPPHKPDTGLIDGAHRLKMLEKATEYNPKFVVSDYELVKASKSFTVDTVKHYSRISKNKWKLFLILGQDCEKNLPFWKGINEILTLAEVLIIPRSAKSSGVPPTSNQIQSGQAPGNWEILDCEQVHISATEIRDRIKNGSDVSEMIPGDVADYIQQMAFYR